MWQRPKRKRRRRATAASRRSPRRAAQGCVFTHCHDPRAVAELRRLQCCRRPLGPAVGPARTRPGERGPDSAGGAARAAQAAAAARQAKGEWLVKNSRSEPHLVPPPTSAAASPTRLSTVVSRLSNVALSQGYDFMKQVPPGFVPPPGAPERKLWDSRVGTHSRSRPRRGCLTRT